MRTTTTMITPLLALALAVPAMAQEGQAEKGQAEKGQTEKIHGERMAGHGGMQSRMMHHSMAKMLDAHAEELGLDENQVERLESVAERAEVEMDRHHAAMESIHEDAMEILTPEQRERIHAMMHEMHAERGESHGGMKKHGEMKEPGDEKKDHDDH